MFSKTGSKYSENSLEILLEFFLKFHKICSKSFGNYTAIFPKLVCDCSLKIYTKISHFLKIFLKFLLNSENFLVLLRNHCMIFLKFSDELLLNSFKIFLKFSNIFQKFSRNTESFSLPFQNYLFQILGKTHIKSTQNFREIFLIFPEISQNFQKFLRIFRIFSKISQNFFKIS